MHDRQIGEATKFRWAQDRDASRVRVLRRRALFLANLAGATLLTTLGFWIHHASEAALRHKLHEALQTVLHIDVAALEFWIENELSNVRDWSEIPEVHESVERLMVIAAHSSDANSGLIGAPELMQLRDVLEPIATSDDYDGFALVSRDGVVLATPNDEYLGSNISLDGMALLAQVVQGKTIMTMPYQTGHMLAGVAALLDAPRMAVTAPVRNDQGKVIAALVFTIPPEKDFTRILSIARIGTTGDTYAFDANGLMLSDSRHDQQLKNIGLIPDSKEARSILRVHLRDPGGDMTRGYQPDTPPTARPLTRLVAAALSGDAQQQIILDPYRDYRGVKVIGAYRWLPNHGFGVATEIAVHAAFAAMRPLRLMVFGLLALLILSALLVLISLFAIQLLRRRVEEIKQLGQYTLEHKIGEGGMGEVYLARHALLRRPTAVKFIRADQISEQNLVRFEREVQLTSQLTHPNTIEIYDYGRAKADVFYYVMEYLPGLTVSHVLELEGAIPPARVIMLLKQICASLAEAHAQGLIHRDVKPLNIILTERGGLFDFVKVLDFGLVEDVSDPEADTKTAVHEVPGTPPYIAPERLDDPSCMDIRSDLYSVAVIGFNLLTGQQPFHGNSAMEIAYQVLNKTAPRPSDMADQAIPAQLDQLMVDCMARDPAHRPASAHHVIARLDAIELTQRWDQHAARNWWLQNTDRLDASARQVAASARHTEQTSGATDSGVLST